MHGVESILVPTDFSPCADAAFKVARAWAQKHEARIELLHVWTAPAFISAELSIEMPGSTSTQLLDLLHREGERRIGDYLATIPDRELLRVRALVRSGEPSSAVLEHAPECDLVVMGTHGRTGLQHLLMGSVAERVVRRASCPVLVVRGREDGLPLAPKRILVPIDFSSHAKLAVSHACQLGEIFGAKVDLLHVVERIPSLQGMEKLAVRFGGDSVASYEAFALDHAKKELDLFLAEHESKRFADVQVVHGDPVEEILGKIRLQSYDMVVIGRRGRTRLGIDAGSTALKILRATPVPVLVTHDDHPIEDEIEDELRQPE